MTEIKRNQLTGQTEIISSSDEAIINNLRNIQGDIRGLPNPEVVLDGDLLTPYRGDFQTSEDDKGIASDSGNKIVEITKLTHNDSGFAKNILENKLKTEKKAA